MDLSTTEKFNWKRITVILLSMVLISILTTELPKLWSARANLNSIKELQAQCPIDFKNGFILDSINLLHSKEFNLYISDGGNIKTEDDKERMKKAFQLSFDNILKGETLSTFRKNGYAFVCNFMDDDGTLIFSFTLDGENDTLKRM
ncbi:MAG TPA: hypothetical protein VFG10_07940 [Saprospiraceae bacterium]|nr:hypothetical protein [Saprospiraceae bacterium]